MASTTAWEVVEELSSDTSEELVWITKPKKAKSKGGKDRPKKEKLEKKAKKEKPEKPKKKKPEKAKPKKKPGQEKPEEENSEQENPDQEKSEREKLKMHHRSLGLLKSQRKEDERQASRLIRCRKNSFSTYFPKVLKNVHVGLSLSQRSVSILDSFVNDMFERIATEVSCLARQNRSPTINSRDIQTAVRLLFPGELCKRAVAEGTMAMVRYISSK